MAQYKVARLGDLGSHGGKIISGDESILVNGKALARVGDIYNCPEHGENPIITGAQGTHGEEQCIAHVGSKTACGATITTGSSDTFVGDPPSPVDIPRKRTWVEFELLDEQSQPVPSVEYNLVLSDGKKQNGSLDKNGFVHIDDVPEGTCHISFPELEKMGKLAKADKQVEPDTLLTRARARSEGADGKTGRINTIMVCSAYMEVLRSGWIWKNPFGHIALRVVVDDKDLTFDFESYDIDVSAVEIEGANLWGQEAMEHEKQAEGASPTIVNPEDHGSLNTWSKFESYKKDQLKNRSLYGYIYLIDRSTALAIIAHYQGQEKYFGHFINQKYIFESFKDSEPIDKSQAIPIRGYEYRVFSHNCANVTSEGLSIALPPHFRRFSQSWGVIPFDVMRLLDNISSQYPYIRVDYVK